MADRSRVYIDESWDAAIDLTLRRLVYGTLAGGLAGLLLFRGPSTRAAAAGFGAGCGGGSAYQVNQQLFHTLIGKPSK